MGKLSLYWHTVKHLKPEQIIYRITKKVKMPCTLGVKGNVGTGCGLISLLPQLDFDPVFLKRFPVEELMRDSVTLLHETEVFHWNTLWRFDNRSALWNYNLHYFEYLFPLVKIWLDTREERYLEKLKKIIRGWIRLNPQEKAGTGWDLYPISLRLINWLNCYGYLEPDLDDEFKQELLASMKEQYIHLATHLEKHLLGNHYFENLKTLVICSIFFQDNKMTEAALRELKKQCAEQILPDGMHFELSPMYHKLILEDMLRTAAALRKADRKDEEIEQYLQPMVDVAYSLEEGLERIPLFNDCGNNVAKSLDALVLAAKEEFQIIPQYKSQLPDSGYYIFKTGDWKMIVDAGQPGPDYLPGHAHCDAMSFELFHKGRPILVNCGTYAYQCEDRLFYKNTSAHNTVRRKGVEQSQCWGSFRMGKRAVVKKVDVNDHSIKIVLFDQCNSKINRLIHISETEISIVDESKGEIQSYYHCNAADTEYHDRGMIVSRNIRIVFPEAQSCIKTMMNYAPEYGKKNSISTIIMESCDSVECKIVLC